MKKLTKNHLLVRDDLSEKLKDSLAEIILQRGKIEDEVKVMNEKITSYNELLVEVENWRDDIVGEMEDYIGERSEKWSETDAANYYDDWKSEFENLDTSPLDEVEEPDYGEDASHSDDLEALPEQPES